LRGEQAVPFEHIAKIYDKELDRLNKMLLEMSGLAESQLASAIESVSRRDTELATEVIESDARADQLERDIDNLVIRHLALRHPIARDLRETVVALKIASDLERICDYAANVAKRSIPLSQTPPIQPVHALLPMGRFALLLIKDVIDAYVALDADKALGVWVRDQELDQFYADLFRVLLTYMMEDSRNIGACTHLLFMAKNIERIGDHATNIAENVHYLVHGVPLDRIRPKADKSSLEVVGPRGSKEWEIDFLASSGITEST
jgi:phosphate transport system protein